MTDSPSLHRDPDAALIGGVCAGVAASVGIDPILVRVAFGLVVVATAGIALVGYAIAWALIPAGDRPAATSPGSTSAHTRASEKPASENRRRGNGRIAAGVGLLTLSLLLVLRELGFWWSDALIWPLVLAASGAALLWRLARSPAVAPAPEPPPIQPSVAERQPAPPGRPRPAIGDLYRGGFGVALVLGAVLLFLSANDVLGETRDFVLTVIVASAGLALILAPFLVAARAQARRRAHRADPLPGARRGGRPPARLGPADARAGPEARRRPARGRAARPPPGARAARVARRRRPRPGPASASPTRSRRAAAEVEDAHGVADRGRRRRRRAARRARRGARRRRRARRSSTRPSSPPSGGPVRLYAEVERGQAHGVRRDRGPGFDPASRARRPPRRPRVDHRAHGTRTAGARMIRTEPGDGTEVELTIGRR